MIEKIFSFKFVPDSSSGKAQNTLGYEITIGISLDLFWVYEYLLQGTLPLLMSHHIEHRSNDEYLYLRECKEPLQLVDV